jgi:hypothetical protein
MKKYSNTTVYKDESRLFYFALAIFVVTVCAYMYFVSSAIAHVVMRKEADSQISGLTTKVGELEAAYIERQHTISSEIASLQGFIVTDTKIFIDKTKDTLVLSQN